MAFPVASKYVAEFVLLKLGVASHLTADVAVGDTSVGVFDPAIFDPSGGAVHTLDSDVFTYTAIQDNTLTGIPASGDDSIETALNGFDDIDADVVVVGGLLASEVDAALNRSRVFIDGQAVEADTDKKIFRFWRGWLGSDITLRDSSGQTFNLVTADTVDFEHGSFEFTAAQTKSFYYVHGYAYNPFYAMADLLERFGNDDRFLNYVQAGQSARSKRSVTDMTKILRGQGALLNF